jgi:hypothetical protein
VKIVGANLEYVTDMENSDFGFVITKQDTKSVTFFDDLLILLKYYNFSFLFKLLFSRGQIEINNYWREYSNIKPSLPSPVFFFF